MKFFLLSDNNDTLMGMRLVGIDGKLVDNKKDLLGYLDELLEDKTIGIILVTTKLVELALREISELKLKTTKGLIVEIPDRHNSENIGKAIDGYVSEAIGIKL